jgi:hypothetical protein
MLVFAEEDRGSGYYRDRVESSRSPFVRRGLPTVRRYEGLGHLPSGATRSRVLDDILSAD